MKALSISNQLRPISVGFDNVFDQFERIFNEGGFHTSTSTYPPYNIVKKGEQLYDIEVALAGYGKKDIAVDYADNLLNIKTVKQENIEDTTDVIHKGIAKRYFSRSFTIADDVEVKGAELKDGLLKVSLERIVPEGKKARSITIK